MRVMTQVDLEISLYRRDASGDSACYGIELRYNDLQSEADRRLGGLDPVHFDPAELRLRMLDAAAYGEYLAGQLLAEPAVRSFFDQAVAVAQAQQAPLRLRLSVGPTAPELHNLRWETLRLPGAAAPLLTGENLRFSRYLSGLDWRPVRLRPQADLRALVAVAGPSDVTQYQLAEVDTAASLAAARAGLGDIATDGLATCGQVTLNNLAARLRDGYDILYLVAHGMLVRGEPWLFLEKEDGKTDRVPGRELATCIQELEDRPRLVVLVSCQSAGTGRDPTAQDGGALSQGSAQALAGLGPRLAEAGVSAVIAMQGDLTLATAAAFMPVFFAELRRDELVDRAVAVARGAVRDRPDWWAPVLFMRLKSGRIGYRAGFGDEKEGLRKWPALMNNIQSGRCTPILGPGLTESLLGSRREIAMRWAETFGYPMDPNSRESLPQVAQYLAVDQDVSFMRSQLNEHMRAEIGRRFGSSLPAGRPEIGLDDAITAVGVQLASSPTTQTFRMLASLPAPIYITTILSNLLADALVAADKRPVVDLCRWNDKVKQIPSIFDADREPNYRPTPERPLVYHLFGRLSEPDSLVLTEDDYFDYLIGVTSRNDLVPPVVRRALTDTALLFLGFDLEDWDFRVVFRSIMSREGRNRRSKYAHIAAQIDPESSRITEAEGAKRYLEEYLGDADISIYWGSVTDFGRELAQRIGGKG
jgi:hypothetical protein